MTRELPIAPAVGGRVPRTVYLPLLLAVFLGGLDVTALNTALPALDGELRPGASGRLWIVDGYALAVAALLVTAARIGDRRGRRTTLVAGLVLFGATSLLAGLAPTGGMLIGARIGQGAADALIVSSVVGSIGAVYAGPQRVVAYGLWTGSFSLGMALGPVLGGALVRSADWRWVFLLNLPVVVLAVLAAIRWLPQTVRPRLRPAIRRVSPSRSPDSGASSTRSSASSSRMRRCRSSAWSASRRSPGSWHASVGSPIRWST